MDFNSGEPRAHIRAPSLKRGKNDNGLNERVSFDFVFFLIHCFVIQFDSRFIWLCGKLSGFLIFCVIYRVHILATDLGN